MHEDFDEDLIWDSIMENAKLKVDYAGFAALFAFSPDNFLSSIIYGVAVGSSPEVIAEKIAAQVFMTGNTVDTAVLIDFVNGSRESLAGEVALTVRALQMLDDGAEGEDVYAVVAGALRPGA